MILDGVGRFEKTLSTTITQDNRCFTSSLRPNHSCLMITNALEFPCVEASRCYLTEKEHGLRLSLSLSSLSLKSRRNPAPEDIVYTLGFTKNRSKSEEWYVQFDTETTAATGRTLRTVQFRHVVTGQYLHSSQDGGVGTQSYGTQWTTWLMEPAKQDNHSMTMNVNTNTNMNMNMNMNMEHHNVYYTLIPKSFAPMKLAYTTASLTETHRLADIGGYAPAGAGLTLLTTNTGEAAIWELEFSSGELCFMSNPVMHCQIRCNVFGQLSLSNNRFQGWEVFRFIEVGNGNVAISSWTHAHKFLSSDPDGKVSTTENRLGHWEKWRLEKADHGVCIVSLAHSGRYLSVGKRDGEVLHTTTKPNDYAKWHLDAAHSHVYFLSAVASDNKLQVASSRSGAMLTKNRRVWEEWKMERSSDGYITLWSKTHNTFLGCNSAGDVHTTSTKGDWSMWEMEESPHGGVHLKSKAHHRLLAIQNQILCTTQDLYTPNESWRLEPRLPPTISGPKLAALGAAGVVGIALTVAMPYAVLGVVEAAGLTATELTVMAGLSPVAGYGGGALLGATVLGTTAALVDDGAKPSDMSPTTAEAREDYSLSAQRPISAWRNW